MNVLEVNVNHKEMFEGFQNTPLLWENTELVGLKQFRITNTSQTYKPNEPSKLLRLGKWIEAYTSFQLNAEIDVDIIEENIQIKRDKRTIGELDLLLLKDNEPIHLEIAYKFYLYDTRATYSNPLEYWIGPNRNDSLSQKIKKLNEKQLPLLHKAETVSFLKNLNINPFDVKQYVNLKAQLYVPFNMNLNDIYPLNKGCIKGWYLAYESISELKEFQFYLPTKLHWLCEPKLKVNWMNFDEAHSQIRTFIENEQSPLCWVKMPNNALEKCFITWW